MGISAPALHVPYWAVREESVLELCVNELACDPQGTYEIQEAGAKLIIAILLVKLLVRPSISIHLGHALASLQLLNSSASIIDEGL